MKIIAIGDIHGRGIWKKILDKEQNFDVVIFIGDYFDSKERMSIHKQVENFKDIVAFKEKKSKKVNLLFGNHDFHYLHGITERYSGYQTIDKKEISKYINKAYDNQLFELCTHFSPYLFSHAGLTKTWCTNNFIVSNKIEGGVLVKEVNDLFNCFPQQLGFTPGINNDSSGDDVTQSPIWVRPNSLQKDGLKQFIQVVGHTVQSNLLIESNFAFIDTLGTSAEYLLIENGVIKANKVW